MKYNMWSQLNKKCLLFDFIMYHSTMSQFGECSRMEQIEPYHILLGGGAGVGKSVVFQVFIEYLKSVMK